MNLLDASIPRLVAKGALILDLSRCRGCLECEEICPTGVLVLPFWPDSHGDGWGILEQSVCIMCRYCLTFCPDKALSSNP